MRSNHLRYYHYNSPMSRFTGQIAALELVWPLPLIVLGVSRVLDPFLISIAMVLALLPWVARWFIYGKLTRCAFLSSALILLVISAFIGMWASYDPVLSWPLFLTLLGSVFLFFAMINTRISPHHVGEGLVVVAGLLALYFVGQYSHFYYPYEEGRLADLGRLTGSVLPNLVFFTPHPNAAAGFLESVWLLSLVLTWQAHGGRRIIWGVLAVIISYGLLISGSRGAWLGLAAALGVGVWLFIPRRSLRLLIGGGGVVAALSLSTLFCITSIRSQIPFLDSFLSTAASRLILYRNSLNLWSDYLFTGIGLGDTFAWAYSRYQLLIPYQFLTYSHNLFLSIGLSFGLMGCAAMVWLLVSFYWFVIRVETKGVLRSRSWSLFQAAWLGATVTFLHGLFDAPQLAGSGWTMPMLTAVLGLVVATGRPALIKGRDEFDDAEPAIPNPWGWWVKGGAAIAAIVLALIFWRPLLSAWYANLGAIHQTRSELTPKLDDSAREAEAKLAVDDFARALDLNPTQTTANLRLGLMALDRKNFDSAAAYLEQAYLQKPGNQAILKSLGYTYLWLERLDDAELLLRQVDNQDELIEELSNWRNWYEAQGQTELSKHAQNLAQRLSVGL